MKYNKELQQLMDWEQQYRNINQSYELVKVAFHANVECPAFNSTFMLFDKYTDVLSDLLGDDDQWLNWYAWENSFGTKGLEAKAPTWKKLRKINSITKLLTLINDCKRK